MIYTNENWKPPVTYCEPNKVEVQKMNKEEAIEKLKVFAPMVVDDTREALDMAIEALKFAKHFDLLKEYQSLQEVVQCKDCQHANECHKNVQYTRNELNTVTIGYSPIEWCSRGERREP